MKLRHPVRWGLAIAALGLVAGVGSVVVARPGARESIGRLSRIPVERRHLVASMPPLQASLAVVSHGPDEVELCGGGWIKATTSPGGRLEDPRWNPVTMAPVARAINASLAHVDIVGRLRSNPDDLARATALAVEINGLERPVSETRLPEPVDPTPARDALARLAASSTDPQVYAIALWACGGGTLGGACRQINPAQWTRLDPGNAAPWLYALDAAARNNDAAGVDEALHRIGTARRSDFGYYTTVREALRVLPQDDASLLAGDRLVEGLSYLEAFGMPKSESLIKACKGDALRDVNRAQDCQAAATTLAERSESLSERRIGWNLGGNLGWDADRTQRPGRASFEFWFNRSTSLGDLNRFDCAAVRARVASMRSLAASGDIAAMNEWLARTGKTDADLQRDERARMIAEMASGAASDGSGR